MRWFEIVLLSALWSIPIPADAAALSSRGDAAAVGDPFRASARVTRSASTRFCDGTRPNRPAPRGSADGTPFPLAAAPRRRDEDDGAAGAASESVRRRRSWEESYALLRGYRDAHGHCNVPQSSKPLGPWVNAQRTEHARYLSRGGSEGDSGKVRRTSMTSRRKRLLDEIGFVWDAMGHTWSTRYAELCEFRKTNGHCVVPRSNGRLGAWVEKQRIEYKKYRAIKEDAREDGDRPKTILTEDRVRQLDDVGFVWDVREKQFEQKLGQLRIFREMNGHIDPRLMNGQLAPWVRKREQQYRKYLDASAAGADEDALSGILPENRRVALEDAGFCRSMFDELPRARWVKNRRATWGERYEELKEYKEVYGHCVVPKKYGGLGSWVRAQRHLMKDGEVSDERVDALDRLGFVWDVHQWQWNQTFYELLQYKEEHNDANVPMSYGGLGLWVFNQRAHYNSYRKGNESLMTPERLAMLKSIGFEFDLGKKIRSAADERWHTRLDELKEYEAKWQTFNVKQSHNPTLYNWCGHQRRCYRAKLQGKNSPLNKQREDALKTIGFLDGIT